MPTRGYYLGSKALMLSSHSSSLTVEKPCNRSLELTTAIPIALWPLFHYLLWQDVATEHASADAHYPSYEAVNLAFAQRIAEIYRPGDLIWVHDYHLLLVPRLLREQIGGVAGSDAVVGLFVHTPFPSSEVFRCLPRECLIYLFR